MIDGPQLDRTVLITGASGFIGSNLVRAAIADGWAVIAPCRAGEMPWRLRDIVSSKLSVRLDWNLNCADHVFDLIAEVHPDVVVNAAAQGSHSSERNIQAMFETNVVALAMLAEASRKGGARRLIQLGSVLGYQPSTDRLSESDPLNPETLYGLTKSLAASIGDYFQRCGDLAFNEFRLFNIYGPWDDDRKLVPYVITQALAGEEIRLTSGQQMRDFVYVGDAVRCILAAAADRLSDGVAYNVCTGTSIAVGDLAEKVISLSRSQSVLTKGALLERGDLRDITLGSHQLLKDAGFAPATDISQGLRMTIDWYLERIPRESQADASNK